ncbi:MAG: CHRD domain-containing protein [Opitutaceae bacterium]
MNTTISLVRRVLFFGALAAFALTSRAQVVELRATINAAQEFPTASTSPATGSAIMLYDVAANTFDLIVTINDFANTASASHIHEAAAGAAGSVVTNLGADAVYTRAGNTLRATFRGVTHGGDKLKLLQGQAYFNIHSAAYPGGEVRGQLIAQPKRLVSNFTVAQEQAAQPQLNLAGLNDFGGAVMFYDPVANRVSLRLSIYNFNNTFNNSHYHEGAPGVSGGVVTNLGNNSNAGGYTTANGHISGTFDIPYTGDPIKLLTGGAYLNFHSSTFGPGELRGQVFASDEVPSTRFSNLSVRGFVGNGEQVLIQGIAVNGPEPIRALITAKGPWLSGFGVANALANPRLALFDSGGRQIAVNDDIGPIASGSDLSITPGIPTNPLESALIVVLPPGNYTAIVSGNGGTGIGILEVTDMRNAGLRATASTVEQSMVYNLERSKARSGAKPAVELCEAGPVSLAMVAR